MTEFAQSVAKAVTKIARGKTATYKQIAEAIGRPRAYRAVALCLSKNTDTRVPCHRIIRSDGQLGGYNGLRGKSKEKLLKNEKAL